MIGNLDLLLLDYASIRPYGGLTFVEKVLEIQKKKDSIMGEDESQAKGLVTTPFLHPR